MSEPPASPPVPPLALPGGRQFPTPAELIARVGQRAPALRGAPPHGFDHCLDTGVGIAFESVDRFDLLMSYMGSQELLVLEDVVTEIRRLASIELPLGHDPLRQRVKRACGRLLREIDDERVKVRTLGGDFIDDVLSLKAEVAQHSESAQGHEGEAATIVWASSQRPRVVVLTNDGGAQRVAHERSVSWRNAAQILAALVAHAGLDPEKAYALFEEMDKTSGIAGPRPTDAGWCQRNGQTLL